MAEETKNQPDLNGWKDAAVELPKRGALNEQHEQQLYIVTDCVGTKLATYEDDSDGSLFWLDCGNGEEIENAIYWIPVFAPFTTEDMNEVISKAYESWLIEWRTQVTKRITAEETSRH